jgi:hypothetical protein
MSKVHSSLNSTAVLLWRWGTAFELREELKRNADFSLSSLPREERAGERRSVFV